MLNLVLVIVVKYSILSSSNFPIGTEVIGKFFNYNINGSNEYILLYNISINNVKVSEPYEVYEVKLNRVNGNIISQMLGLIKGENELINRLNGQTMRLVKLKYVILGYDGIEHTNESFLFQPLDGKISSGIDWHLIE
jgi:hypothetical protein